jgi:hypothetical protein
MRWLRRLVAVPFGLALAVTSSFLFLILASIIDPVMGPFAGEALWVGLWSLIDATLSVEDPGPVVDAALADAGRLIATILLLPPTFVAVVGEVIGTRRLVWYAGGTGLLTGALPWLARGGVRVASPEEIRIAATLVMTGAVAGFVYWLAAGRGAGPEPARAPLSGPRPQGS